MIRIFLLQTLQLLLGRSGQLNYSPLNAVGVQQYIKIGITEYLAAHF
jgi:hypothetical protein